MNDKQKEWFKQYSESFGVREFFRFGFFLALWVILGVFALIIFENQKLIYIFFFTSFVFAIFSPRYKFTYSILRKIIGNDSMPPEPMPRSSTKIRHRREWWSYLPSLWWLLMLLLLLYALKR